MCLGGPQSAIERVLPMETILLEAGFACQYTLDYHNAMVEVAKDRTTGSIVRDKKLDELYSRMVQQSRKVIKMLEGSR